MRVLIQTMKRNWVILLVAAASFTAFQCRQKIYAASSAPPSRSAALETTQSQGNSASPNSGADAYADHCAICHGDNREGILPAFPPLLGISRQLNDQQIIDIVHNGKGRMPGFPKLDQDELSALLKYLSTSDASVSGSTGKSAGASSSLSEA